MRRWLLLLLSLLLVAVLGAAMTKVSAAPYTYDASVNSRVEAQSRGLPDASVSPADRTCEGFGARSPAAHACATTPVRSFVATDTEVGGLDDLAAKAADNVQFGQQSVSRTFTTAENGSTFKYVGQRVSDVASRLRSGSISPDELPIEFVVRDGQNIAVNNRSLLALRRAGHDPTVMIDRTGDALIEARTTERLAEMGGAASDTIRVRGAGSNASYLDWLS